MEDGDGLFDIWYEVRPHPNLGRSLNDIFIVKAEHYFAYAKLAGGKDVRTAKFLRT